MTLAEMKTYMRRQFRSAGLDTPDIDARLLLQFAGGWSAADLITGSDTDLPSEIEETLRELTARRLGGEPVDHILGTREFYGRAFNISKDVLSPRPETEGLVDLALKALQGIDHPAIADLGTGSGAIVISILSERPSARGLAVDISEAALKVATGNARRHGVQDRVTFLQSRWFDKVTDRFDIIVSNPPYITDAAMTALSPEVKLYDPDISLRGGTDGLSAYRMLTDRAQDYLKPGGQLITEIGYDQGQAVTEMFRRAGFKDIVLHQDLSGHDRIVSGHK